VRFGDVVRLSSERCTDPVAAGIDRYVGLEHLEPGDLRIRTWGNVADGVTFTNRFRPGQVLFGKRRAYQRKVAVAEFEGICSGDIYVFEPADGRLLADLLPFICQTNGFFEHALKTSAGSLSPRTNWTSLADYQFALPPIEVQRAIARQSVAVESLTAQLRIAAIAGRDLEQSYIDNAVAADSQHRYTVDEAIRRGVIESPQDGNHGEKHPKSSDYVASGIPFLMAADIVDGHVDLLHCKFIAKKQADTLRIGFSQTNDVLLTHKGSVGQSAVVPTLTTDYVMLTPQVTYYRTDVSHGLYPAYLAIVFRSSWFQSQLRASCTGSTRAYIGITAQRKLVITCPPLARQEHVVAVANELRAARQQVERRCAQSNELSLRFVPNITGP
jgi:type I restriction enzyme S subunit